MKDNKTVKIDLRVTPEEKQRLKDFAAQHGFSLSDFIRISCEATISRIQEEEKQDKKALDRCKEAFV